MQMWSKSRNPSSSRDSDIQGRRWTLRGRACRPMYFRVGGHFPRQDFGSRRSSLINWKNTRRTMLCKTKRDTGGMILATSLMMSARNRVKNANTLLHRGHCIVISRKKYFPNSFTHIRWKLHFKYIWRRECSGWIFQLAALYIKIN